MDYTLAEAAYNAYAESRNFTAFNGEPIPNWDIVSQGIKDAWYAAAQAVVLTALRNMRVIGGVDLDG